MTCGTCRFSSPFGVIGHSAVGNLDTGLILVTVVAVFVGAQIGARLMVKTKSEMIRVGFVRADNVAVRSPARAEAPDVHLSVT